MSEITNGNSPNSFSNEALQIIILAYETQNDLVKYHCDLAFKIFTWYTTVLLATLGYSISRLGPLEKHSRLLVSIALFLVSGMVYLWQRKNRLQAIEHAQNVKRIDKLFHFTELGYYSKEGALITTERHVNEPEWCSRYSFSPYNLVLAAITVVVLLVLIFF